MSPFEDTQASIEPAKALANAGFKVATGQEQIHDDTQIVVLSYGVRLVYFRSKLTDTEKQKVHSVLAGIEGVEVLGRQRLDEFGCHDNRSGDLIVAPLPGYTISNAGKKGGQHGRFAERNPILFFHGPGFKRGSAIEAANTVDVVPTLLALVHVQPAKTVDGHPILTALEQN